MGNRKIFLTGSTGFVGSFLLVKFLNQGYHLKLLVRKKNTAADKRIKRIINEFYSTPKIQRKIMSKIEVIRGDISEENLGLSKSILKRLANQTDCIFHCAALTSFDVERRKEIEKQNIEGTKNVLDFVLKTNNATFYHMSTTYVSGKRKGIVTEDELDKGQSFNNPYEESKFKAEKLVKEYTKKYGIKTIICRPSIIVGDSKTGKTRSFFGFYGLIRIAYLIIKEFKKDLESGGGRAKAAGVSYKGERLYIPLRLPWLKNKTLNLVPIDYVIDIIFNIFLGEKECIGKTYHIVNPTPPKLEFLRKSICETFNIIGPRIVNSDDFSKIPMSSWEKLFLRGISNYIPYLQTPEAKFVDRNTQQLLQNKSIRCPQINKRFISDLINYCIKTNWGKN